MTSQELRELDIWIYKNLYGGTDGDFAAYYTKSESYALDVLKKCAEKTWVRIERCSGRISGKPDAWHVWTATQTELEESLELGICKLAKRLFSEK